MLKIVSPRVGEPGKEFVPDEHTNVEALIAGGFIVDDNTPPKPAKPVVTTEEI
jgi:hypothetical protein